MGPQRAAELLADIGNQQVDLSVLMGIHPSLVQQVAEKAIGLMEYGKTDDAETLLTSLSALATTSETIAFLLGACRTKKKDHPGALAAYTDAITRHSAKDSPFIQSVLLCRAQTFLELGEAELARTDLRQAAAGANAQHVATAKAWLSGLEEHDVETR